MRRPKGADKLAAVLNMTSAKIEGMVCADLGCNVGGFTRELLERGASHVDALDTGYGVLDWDLRQNEKVRVLERTNVLHFSWDKKLDIIVSDLAWTPQKFTLPVVFPFLKETGVFFSLLKPQYESKKRVKEGLLEDSEAKELAQEVFEKLPPFATHSSKLYSSPIRGGRGAKGNLEFWIVYSPKN